MCFEEICGSMARPNRPLAPDKTCGFENRRELRGIKESEIDVIEDNPARLYGDAGLVDGARIACSVFCNLES
jgi:hypothetical protein